MASGIIFKFSGHQTFAFRYGWLEKGVRGIDEHSDLFRRGDALVTLGVGKNMVDSIRHWCQVTQLIEPSPNAGKNALRELQPTAIARKLLLNRAWDPFLENDASLWLIHWLLVSNPIISTTWKIAFSYFQRGDFTKRELLDYVAAYAKKKNVDVKESSLARDVDCFVRTYTTSRRDTKSVSAEESFDCPLQELTLIQASPEGELYRFAVGPKPTLPPAVVGYALEQYFEMERIGRNTMGLQECLYSPGSPGQAFRLDENSLIAYIEDLEKATAGKVQLDETAGLKQIYRKPGWEAMELLRNYYSVENHH